MERIHLNRIGDVEIIAEYKSHFETKTLNELVDSYNQQVKCGIVGMHRQALYLIALKQEFKERLKESPVYLIDNVIGMIGPIEVTNDQIKIVKEIKLK